MRKILALTLAVCLMLCGCAVGEPQVREFKLGEEVTDSMEYFDVSIYADADSVTPTGAAFVILNDSGSELTLSGGWQLYARELPLTTGKFYYIEHDETKPLKTIVIKPDEEYRFEVDWAESYGELPEGVYMLELSVNSWDKDGFMTVRFDVGKPDLDRPVTVPEGEEIDTYDIEDESVDYDEEDKYEDESSLKGQIGDPVADQEIVVRDDLFMQINDVHTYGAMITYTNLRDEPVMYGSSFHIEKKVDGVWRWVYADEHIMFPMTSLWLEPGEVKSFFENWESLYFDLPNGDYRYVTSFYINNRAPVVVEEDLVLAAIEFTVSDFGEPIVPGSISSGPVYPASEVDRLVMTVSEESVSPSGLEMIITNDRETEVTYGEEYSLQRKVGGVWYQIKTITPTIEFDSIEYFLSPDKSTKITIDWSYNYGELPKGEYRIVKNFYSEDIPFANDSPYNAHGPQIASIAAEFTVS